MTEQRAIEVLEYAKTFDGMDFGATKIALDMAIKALEEIQQYKAIGTVEELQNAVKEEDVLKFYYIESEDKYVVGQRVDNFYYGEVGKTGLCFNMSRYLRWGEHVIAPDTLWKEYTYPSEPKEIPFFDWLQGFIKKECGGTIEELQALKEKSVAKKPIEQGTDDKTLYKCSCGNVLMEKYSDGLICGFITDYCKVCGQKLLRAYVNWE